MLRFLRPFLILLFCFLTANAFSAEIVGEMRGVWLPAWEFPTKEKLLEVIQQIKAANFNTIFMEVRFRSDALYIPNKNNHLYPNPEGRSDFILAGGDDYDPLELAIKEAHRLGMELHAWVTVYVATRKDSSLADYNYPEDWLSCRAEGNLQDSSGQYWLDPGAPGVNEYLANVFLDIVSNYDLDGFQLDYMRYEQGFGYNPISVARFQETLGTTIQKNPGAFDQWRRDAVTDLVKRLRQGIDWLRPGMPLSVAVFGSLPTAQGEIFQDWPSWIEQDLVDFVVPMCYSESSEEMASYAQVDLESAPKNRVVIGLGILPRKNGKLDQPESLVERVNRCKELGSPGVVFFAYGGLADEGGKRFRVVKDNFYSKFLPPPIYRLPVNFSYPVVQLSGMEGKIYSLRVVEKVPHRHALMVAKLMASYTSAPVFVNEDSGWFDVFVGKESSLSNINKLRKEMEDAQTN